MYTHTYIYIYIYRYVHINIHIHTCRHLPPTAVLSIVNTIKNVSREGIMFGIVFMDDLKVRSLYKPMAHVTNMKIADGKGRSQDEQGGGGAGCCRLSNVQGLMCKTECLTLALGPSDLAGTGPQVFARTGMHVYIPFHLCSIGMARNTSACALL